MGNSHPHNQTGRKVVVQKMENARKTGVLSLSEHKLESCPLAVFEITKLTTLDLSKNKLQIINPQIVNLKGLKSLNVDNNRLTPGSMVSLSSLKKLQKLSANNNQLGVSLVSNKTRNRNGKPSPKRATELGSKDTNNCNGPEAFPTALPKSLKIILLSNNSLLSIPKSILTSSADALQKLDLSRNNIKSIPDTIANLVALNDLNLDDNFIRSLPAAIGKLSKLKTLSLRNNQISINSTDATQQPLPEELWTQTPLIDLNLHGNPMTTTQLNTIDGYDIFLARRREVKNKDILGGAMTDLEGCGLK